MFWSTYSLRISKVAKKASIRQTPYCRLSSWDILKFHELFFRDISIVGSFLTNTSDLLFKRGSWKILMALNVLSEVSCRKSIFKSSQISQEITCAKVSFCYSCLKPATLFETRVTVQMFPLHYSKSLVTTFSQKTSGRLLLSVLSFLQCMQLQMGKSILKTMSNIYDIRRCFTGF